MALGWSSFIFSTTSTCVLFVRFLHSLSAQAMERSLFSHHFGHILDRRVALIFWLFMPPSRLISERDTFSFVEDRLLSMAFLGDNDKLYEPDATTSHSFLKCVCGRYCRCCIPHHNLESFALRKDQLFIMWGPVRSSSKPPRSFLQHS